MTSKVLIVGASQCKYATNFSGVLPPFDVHSHSGDKVEDFCPEIFDHLKDYSAIVIQLGTNNVSRRKHMVKDILEKYDRLLKEIRRSNGMIDIFVSGILPRGADLYQPKQQQKENSTHIDFLNSKAEIVNNGLHYLCQRYEGAYFVDHWNKYFSDEEVDRTLLSKDGLHLTPKGLRQLLGDILRTTRSYGHGNSKGKSKRVFSCARDLPMIQNQRIAFQREVTSLRNKPTLVKSKPRKVTVFLKKKTKPRIARNWFPFPSREELSFPSSKLPLIPSTNLPSVASSNLQLPFSNIKSIPSSNLSLIPSPNLPSIPSPKLPSIPPPNLPSISPTNLPSIPSPDLPSIPSPNLPSIPSPNLPSIPSLNLPSIPSHSFHSIPSSDLQQLPPSNIQSLPNFNLPPPPTEDLSSANSMPLRREFCFYQLGGTGIDPSTLKCQSCKRSFRSYSGKNRHICTSTKTITILKEKEKCQTCKKFMSNAESLTHHSCEGFQPRACVPISVRKQSRRPCLVQGCKETFARVNELYHHLEVNHGQALQTEHLVFENISFFLEWKEQEDTLTFLKYFKRGSKTVKGKDGEVTYLYYVCNFHAVKKRIIKYRTGRRKALGTAPCLQCPSRILVKQTKNQVSVKYLKSHNHPLEFKNTVFHQLPRRTIQKIKADILQGVETKFIISKMQDGLGDRLNRIPKLPKKENFLTRQHVNQIKYRLQTITRLDADDSVSVRRRVELLMTENYNPVLIYKPYGEKTVFGPTLLDHRADVFVLGIQTEVQFKRMQEGVTRILCIDATYKTNMYDFYLITYIVPDQWGHGYPVAHFLTNKQDQGLVDCVVTSIFERCVQNNVQLQVNAVMTDDDLVTGPSIQRILGQDKPIRHLLCKWHIFKNWQKNIDRKVKDPGTQQLLYACLQILMELRIQNKFQEGMEKFVAFFINLCPVFTNYFMVWYASRAQLWAMCYRNFPHAQTDTNAFCESFHNKLKTYYMSRKRNMRVDELLDVLFTAEKDRFNTHLNASLLGINPPYLANDILTRHKRGLKIPDSSVVTVSGEKWFVRTSHYKNLFYEISRLSSSCPIPDFCFERCAQRVCEDLCGHLFSCTCPDQHPLCKHIHKVYSMNNHSHAKKSFGPPEIPTLSLPHFQTSSAICPDTSSQVISIIAQLEALINLLKDPHYQTFASPFLSNLSRTISNYDLLIRTEADLTKSHKMLTTFENQKVHITPNKKMDSQKRLLKKKIALVKNKRGLGKDKSIILDRKIKVKAMNILDSRPTPVVPSLTFADMNTVLLRFGDGIGITLRHLKSLEVPRYLLQNEILAIQGVDRNFVPGWLYDDVIDAYFHLLTSDPAKKCVVFPCWASQAMGYDRETIPRPPNLLTSKTILVPFNPGNHWVLLICYPVESKIIFLDPSRERSGTGSRPKLLDSWSTYFTRFFQRKFKILQPDHVTQEDSYNCGVFVCRYGLYAVNNKPFTDSFSPDQFRQDIYTIIAGNCLKGKQKTDINLCSKCEELVRGPCKSCSACSRKAHIQCVNTSFSRC